MTTRFDLVTIDAVDSEALAAYWAGVLNLVEVQREDAGRWIVLADTDGLRRVGIQRIGDLSPVAAVWEGKHKARIHLDLVCELNEFDTEVERLTALGAVAVRPVRREYYGAIATLADIEGNVFDLCAYE